MEETLRHDQWAGTTYGSSGMHRWLIKLLRVTDVRLIYAFTNLFIVPVTMLVIPKGARFIYRYMRRRWDSDAGNRSG